MQFGDTFSDCDFASIQEHRLRGASRDAAARRLLEAGWDIVLDEAYTKISDAGGGTALLGARWSGVRPVSRLSGEAASALERLQGRISLGIIDVIGGILLVSFYGLDGQPVAKQVELWHDMGRIIMLLGLPFVILADWQVTPRDMTDSKWPKFMHATIAAPSAPTNLVSKRCIDFAVMSECLANLVESVEVVVGARFSPHAPVKIRLKCPRSLGSLRRLVRPRLYDAERPPIAAKDAIEIDWGGDARP